MSNILFLEAGPTMIAKNLLPIAKKLSKIEKKSKFFFVSIDILSHADKGKELESIREIENSFNSSYFTVKSLSPRHIKKFINRNKIEVLVLDAYRIYDMLWTFIAKKNDVRVYGFQHGFEVDNVYYKPNIILNKFTKSFRVFFAIFELSKLMDENFLKMLKDFSKFFFKGINDRSTFFHKPSIHPDHFFIYSDYYRMFWNKRYGLDPKKMTVIGPPDLMMVKKIKKKTKIKGCCYLTQTLVEDGRMSLSEFKNLIGEYIEISKLFDSFVIKMHPRGDKNLYKDLAKRKNVTIVQDFPNCEFYITHYSSTAFVAYNISPNVILHELRGHVTPEIYQKFGFKIIKNADNIISICKEKNWAKINVSKKILNDYAPIPKKDPNQRVAELISKFV